MPDLPMILAVAGGRSYRWRDDDTAMFEHLVRFLGVAEIWHGGANGVEQAVDEHARRMGLDVRVFLPEPSHVLREIHTLFVRTSKMIEDLDRKIHVDGHRACVAAWPGGTLTDFACGQARRCRLHVIDLRMRICPEPR